MFEIIPKNGSKIYVSVVLHSPEKSEEVFDYGVCTAHLPGETPEHEMNRHVPRHREHCLFDVSHIGRGVLIPDLL